MKKPNQPRYPVEFSKYFNLCDMYIGAVLELNKWKFELIDADEYAYMYLEKHSDEVTTDCRNISVAIIINSLSLSIDQYVAFVTRRRLESAYIRQVNFFYSFYKALLLLLL